MKHTAQKIEEAKEQRASKSIPENKTSSGKKKRTLPEAARPYMFKPGQSGNPGGRPKHDVAAELARLVIEGNFEAAAEAFAKQLKRGSAYTFSVLADRGYGKMKEVVKHEGEVQLTIADVRQRIAELERLRAS